VRRTIERRIVGRKMGRLRRLLRLQKLAVTPTPQMRRNLAILLLRRPIAQMHAEIALVQRGLSG
jgi:hypothetical protein